MSITTRGCIVLLDGITTGREAVGTRDDWTGGLLGMLRSIIAPDPNNNSKPITAVNDFCGRFKPGVGANSSAVMKAGVLAYDFHPFIRGKTFATGLVDINFEKSGGQAKGGENRRKLVSRSLPDQMAIAMLEKELQKAGLFDWRPDGVVLSKESSGDAMADHEFDTRLQQLFNVAVQGPATLTNLVGDKQMITMPGDLVFVAIVCDRYTPNNKTTQVKGATGAVRAFGNDVLWEKGLSRDCTTLQIQQFNEWRKAEFSAEVNGNAVRQQLKDNLDGTAGTAPQLGNFRVRMETSSHMIHTSGTNPPKDATSWKRGNQRMGLGWGPDLAEYAPTPLLRLLRCARFPAALLQRWLRGPPRA